MKNAAQSWHVISVLLCSIGLILPTSADAESMQSAGKHYPFTWLHAPNNAPSSASSNIDIDGSTAALLFPMVSALPPRLIEANFERQLKLLQSGEAVCTGRKLVTPERAAIGAYSSVPQLFAPGLRLFVRKGSDYAKGIAAGQAGIAAGQPNSATVSVQTLAQLYPQLIFGAVSGRSYTNQLDQIFATMRQQNRLWQRSASDMASGMTQMLANGRVDAIVEYASFVTKLYADKSEWPFDSYRITEAPLFANGYILCSGDESGKLLARRFSEAISEASTHISYLQAHLKWFAPEDHSAIVTYYNDIYGTAFTLQQAQQ